MSKKQTDYQRPQGPVLAERLAEPRRFVQVVAGPRQVGKSTLIEQVTAELGLPLRYVSADEPTLRGAECPSRYGRLYRRLQGAPHAAGRRRRHLGRGFSGAPHRRPAGRLSP